MGEAIATSEQQGAVLACPSPIQAEHDLADFDCGKPILNAWLKNWALKQEGRSARTYVVGPGQTVVGYYTIATGGIEHAKVMGKLRRNMPDPLPIMVLGRLAVDKQFHCRGIGSGLLRDALQRTLQAAAMVGVAALILHAIDEEAAAFYAGFGFAAFPEGSRTLFLPVETIRKAL